MSMQEQLPALLDAVLQRNRFLPMIGDSMEPTLRNGDLVAVVPVDRFRCDGLYVFAFLGEPDVYRCSANFHDGGIDIYKDNGRYGRYTLSPESFRQAVIGQVLATCNIIDRTLLEL